MLVLREYIDCISGALSYETIQLVLKLPDCRKFAMRA